MKKTISSKELAEVTAAKFTMELDYYKRDVRIREYERQLILIADYANDLKCVQKG